MKVFRAIRNAIRWVLCRAFPNEAPWEEDRLTRKMVRDGIQALLPFIPRMQLRYRIGDYFESYAIGEAAQRIFGCDKNMEAAEFTRLGDFVAYTFPWWGKTGMDEVVVGEKPADLFCAQFLKASSYLLVDIVKTELEWARRGIETSRFIVDVDDEWQFIIGVAGQSEYRLCDSEWKNKSDGKKLNWREMFNKDFSTTKRTWMGNRISWEGSRIVAKTYVAIADYIKAAIAIPKCTPERGEFIDSMEKRLPKRCPCCGKKESTKDPITKEEYLKDKWK